MASSVRQKRLQRRGVCTRCGGSTSRAVRKLCRSCYADRNGHAGRVLPKCIECSATVSAKGTKQCRTCFLGYTGAKPIAKCCDCGTRVTSYRQRRCHPCNGKHRCGSRNPHWKGGVQQDLHGYRVVLVDGQQIFEHRLVMEEQLGRSLLPNESVHHKNGVRNDNRPENLELWASRSHPGGQRVSDLIYMALGILELYAPEKLNHEALHVQGAIERLIDEKAPHA